MQTTTGKYWGNQVYPLNCAIVAFLLCAVPLFTGGCAATNSTATAPENIPLLEKWSGDYPVSELDRLPGEHHDAGVGYIGDSATFIPVWRAFMPDQILPAVDFTRNIVVFTRNTQYYNRTSILKVTLQDKAAEVIAMETMSAMPLEDNVAMAMAVIPREGIVAIQAGTEKIKITDYK